MKCPEVKLIHLPVFSDKRGNLTFLENNNNLPFTINRVFWTFDVPAGDERGGHAYIEQHECIVALSGSFDVVVSRSKGSFTKYTLNRAYKAIYLPPMTWRHTNNYSTNALSLHLSSHVFKDSDYIRDYNLYIEKKNDFDRKL